MTRQRVVDIIPGRLAYLAGVAGRQPGWIVAPDILTRHSILFAMVGTRQIDPRWGLSHLADDDHRRVHLLAFGYEVIVGLKRIARRRERFYVRPRHLESRLRGDA